MNITSPRQLINALPTLFGKISDNSMLVILLDDGHVLSTFQVPLSSEAPDFNFDLASEQLDKIATGSARSLVAIGVLEDENAAHLALSNFQNLAQTHQDHVLDLLHIFDGRWRSILCQDESCCPQAGHSLQQADEEHSLSTEQSQWLPDDEQLRLTACNLTEEELDLRDRAFSALPKWPVGSPEELFDWRDGAVTEVMDLLGSFEYDQWSALAKVSTALADIRTRDGVLRRILEHEDQREVASVNLVRMYGLARSSDRAAIATVLAGAIWLGGNQALTRYAIDVALEQDSEYSLARLLDTALVHGVPHRVWVDSLTAVGYDKCLAGAA